MKKVGDFWLPDIDMLPGKNREKSIKSFEHSGGPQIHHLLEALELVDNWQTALDGGANIGSWSKVLKDRFKEVHAFEPAEDTYEALAKNIECWNAQDTVHTYQMALSDERTNVSMQTAKKNARSVTRQIVAGGDIQSIRIDDLSLTRLDFLKLDVEGYEEKALRGALETIEKFKPVVMIENKASQNAKYGDSQGAHRLLIELGYENVAQIGEKKIDWVYKKA